MTDDVIVAGDDAELLGEADDVIVEDGERPEDCQCGEWNAGDDLACWSCYREGFEGPAGE